MPPVLGVRLEDPVALEPRGVPGFVPGSATLVAGRLAEANAKLLPPGLSQKLSTATAGEPITLGPFQGYRYRGLSLPDEAGRNDLYVLATDQGTIAVSCFAGEEVSATYLRQCGAIAGTLQGTGLKPLPIGASPAYGAQLSRTMTELNASRTRLRSRLQDARTPTGQARISERTASIYRTAAGALASATPPPSTKAANRRIVRQMRLIASSYDALASAARANRRGAFNAARAQVRRREARLDELLGRLRAAGYQTD
ncbi:MAG: hypothetical protein JHC95_14940 [Solirubrobacteraceae bacterium]|nr:hypothetical protein [Solirubrobacteraceae bacterium]